MDTPFAHSGVPLPDGRLPGDTGYDTAGYYQYVPSIVQLDEDHRAIYYYANKIEYDPDEGNGLEATHDHAAFNIGTRQADGSYEWGPTQYALQPRLEPGDPDYHPATPDWAAYHICDPDVVKGEFNYNSTTYQWAMFFTAADNDDHGVGGLTLGGGMGWLARQFGLSCDNVASYEVVTAAGDTVTASATENSDLYWGLRGGGGNFGVVTEFEFRIQPVAGRTVVADYSFAIDDGVQAMKGWRDLIEVAPRQATFKAWVGSADGRPCASLGFVWVGNPDGSLELQREFAALGTPIEQSVTEHSYVDLQRLEDDVQAHALRRYWKGHYLRELPDEAIEAFLLRGTSDGSGDLLPNASFQAYGGAISDVADDETAFSHRDALVEFNSASRWENPAEDDGRIAAARQYSVTIESFASGAYVNALTDEGSAGVRRAYPEHKLTRLTALKDTWDPDNVFHLNHNIAPSPR